MQPGPAIEVAAPCADWGRICPAAEEFARAAARLAIGQAMTAAGMAPHTTVELSVSLVDDRAQRRLNRVWRGRDQATNVLAFPAWDRCCPAPPEVPLLLGDVVLAFETTQREAAEQGKPLTDHLRHLIVHGVLHLFGYDHRSDAEAATMEALEIAILSDLGVPDPYRGTI